MWPGNSEHPGGLERAHPIAESMPLALTLRRALALAGILLLVGLAGCYQPVETPPLGPGECRVDLDCPDRLTCVRDDGPIGLCQCRATSPACFNGIDGRACACDADGCSCQPADSPAACPSPQPAAASAQCSGAQLCAPDGTCACFRDEQCPPGRRCQADDRGMGRCACPYGEAEDGTCVAPDAPNACGGDRPLSMTAGEACGVGDWGRWTCTGCDSARCCAPWAETPTCCAPDEGQWACAAESLGVPCCDPDTEMPDPCGRCVRREQLGILESYGFVPGQRADDPCLPEPDRPEVDGRWVCDARGQPRCLACTDDDRNVCGGCGRLEVLGQERSEDIGDLLDALRAGRQPECDNARHGFAVSCPGLLRCEGGNTVRCRGEAPNACGECGGVAVCTDEGAPGAVDAAACCQLQGTGPLDECTERAAPFDLPGGLGALVVGTPCGDEGCGRLTCAPAAQGGGQVMRCENAPDLPNACGGCAALRPLEGHCRDVPRCLAPTGDCTTFGEEPGQWVCAADQQHVICVPSFRNECGGARLLDQRPGIACVAPAADGALGCPSVYVCSPDDPELNETRCDPVARNACGCCETECQPPFLEPPACPPYGPNLPARTECLSDGTARVCVVDGDADGRCVCLTAQGETENCTFLTASVPPRLASCRPVDGGFECSCLDANDRVPDCGGRNELCCPSPIPGQLVCPGALQCLYDANTNANLCRCGGPGQVCCGGVSCDSPSNACLAGTCGPCGTLGLPCCDGQTCADGGLSCQSGACGLCGGPGQPCCSGDTCAGAGFTCGDGGTCVQCGGANQPCCGGTDCTGAGLSCQTGQCRACGVAGTPCCDGVSCGANLLCNAQTSCVPCGAVNGLCCANNTCGAAGRVCNVPTQTCLACGGVGQRCCENATCNAGGLCQNNSCVACGAAVGQPCCANNTCTGAGLACGAFVACVPCGGTNQPCCGGNACTAPGRVCDAQTVTCADCGDRGERCCAGNTCTTGVCNPVEGECL